MPHFVVDCSDSVLELAEPSALMRAVHDAASSTGLFDARGVGGIKVRLHPYEHHINVDSQQHFVHVFAHIMEGRTEPQKRDLARTVVESLVALLPTVEIISMNIADFEGATYCNASMLRTSRREGASSAA